MISFVEREVDFIMTSDEDALCLLLFGVAQIDGARRCDRGDRVLVDHLRFAVTVKNDNKIVIAGDDPAHLKAVDQKHGQRDARTARVEEKQVLQVGDFFHDVSVLSFYPE